MSIQSEHDKGKLVTITRAYFDGLVAAIDEARLAWLEENDPKDGTDCVTPYDHLLYGNFK